mmetsp:Transcript_174669/g.560151  ORF Transcript_174669/g.560151 Transcript_174669/m.560151 type:complete len:477 (+) Transcript_174669:1740-3170(+)
MRELLEQPGVDTEHLLDCPAPQRPILGAEGLGVAAVRFVVGGAPQIEAPGVEGWHLRSCLVVAVLRVGAVVPLPMLGNGAAAALTKSSLFVGATLASLGPRQRRPLQQLPPLDLLLGRLRLLSAASDGNALAPAALRCRRRRGTVRLPSNCSRSRRRRPGALAAAAAIAADAQSRRGSGSALLGPKLGLSLRPPSCGGAPAAGQQQGGIDRLRRLIGAQSRLGCFVLDRGGVRCRLLIFRLGPQLRTDWILGPSRLLALLGSGKVGRLGGTHPNGRMVASEADGAPLGLELDVLHDEPRQMRAHLQALQEAHAPRVVRAEEGFARTTDVHEDRAVRDPLNHAVDHRALGQPQRRRQHVALPAGAPGAAGGARAAEQLDEGAGVGDGVVGDVGLREDDVRLLHGAAPAQVWQQFLSQKLFRVAPHSLLLGPEHAQVQRLASDRLARPTRCQVAAPAVLVRDVDPREAQTMPPQHLQD